MKTPAEQYADSEHAEVVAKIALGWAEDQRREKPSLTGYPLTGEDNTVIDYGRSGQAMELAMSHLREAVPNGQRLRASHAANALKIAVAEHLKWLKAKGYDVDPNF